MKTKFLIATAVTALLAGSAFAQGPTPSTPQSSPSAGASGSMNSGSSVDTKGSMNSQGSAPGAATTGAGTGASTETKKADDFKTKGASDQTPMKQRGAQDKMNQKGAQDKKSGMSKSETTGQAPSPRSGTQTDTNAQQRGDGAAGSKTGQSGKSGDMNRNQSQDNQRTGQSGDNARSGSTTNVNVNLSTEQRTRIKEVIVRDKSAPRVSSVNFSINVGTAVPRTVKHVMVPRTIVEIYPAWSGFHYFMAGDQIVIIDPATLRIVAVLDA